MLDFQGKPWSCPSSCLKFWLPNRPSQRRVVPVAGCGMPWFSASSTSSTTQPSFAIKKHKSTKPLSNFLPLILNKHAPPHWDPCLNRSNTKPRFLGHQVMPTLQPGPSPEEIEHGRIANIYKINSKPIFWDNYVQVSTWLWEAKGQTGGIATSWIKFTGWTPEISCENIIYKHNMIL